MCVCSLERIGQVVAAKAFDVIDVGDCCRAEALSQVGEGDGAVAQRTAYAGGARKVGGCEHEVDVQGRSAADCGAVSSTREFLTGLSLMRRV